jgi:hypothetical protein
MPLSRRALQPAGLESRESAMALREEKMMRWLEFALNEARIEGKFGDFSIGQPVDRILRASMNWCTIGKDAGSAELIRLNPWMSREAWVTRRSSNPETLTNEHEDRVAHVWNWMITAGPSSEDVVARMRAWPIVTITESERLKLKGRDDWPADVRFKNVITVGKLDKGIWVAR